MADTWFRDLACRLMENRLDVVYGLSLQPYGSFIQYRRKDVQTFSRRFEVQADMIEVQGLQGSCKDGRCQVGKRQGLVRQNHCVLQNPDGTDSSFAWHVIFIPRGLLCVHSIDFLYWRPRQASWNDSDVIEDIAVPISCLSALCVVESAASTQFCWSRYMKILVRFHARSCRLMSSAWGSLSSLITDTPRLRSYRRLYE